MLIKLNNSHPDVILLTGDHYVDHPSFGIAVIARVLQNEGYSVWICAQPDAKDNFKEIDLLPKPNLFFGITSGCIDSTVNLYTVNRVKRKTDAYTDGGSSLDRIRNTLTTYANKVRSSFKDSFIVLGGVEATLRRFAHYDFFTQKIQPSLLENCSADVIVYGSGENTIKDIAKLIKENKKDNIFDLKGITYKLPLSHEDTLKELKHLTDSESLKTSPEKMLPFTEDIYKYSQPFFKEKIYQKNRKSIIVQNPPAHPLTSKEMDYVHSLPFTYLPIPKPKKMLKAFETVRNTVISHRGCGGGCSFCAISLNQGKLIQSRSIDNILEEIDKRHLKSISDLQGPTANLYGARCKREDYCQRSSCLFPQVCNNLVIDENVYLRLLKKVNSAVKHLSISSGIRFDIPYKKALDFILKNDIAGGQLKVAPENCDDEILDLMRKPDFKKFEHFVEFFKKTRKKYKKDIYLIPYIISAFPTSTYNKTKKLKEDLIRLLGFVPFQIQDFTPTPTTIATALYLKLKKISAKEREKMRDLLHEKRNKTTKEKRTKQEYKKSGRKRKKK